MHFFRFIYHKFIEYDRSFELPEQQFHYSIPDHGYGSEHRIQVAYWVKMKADYWYSNPESHIISLKSVFADFFPTRSETYQKTRKTRKNSKYSIWVDGTLGGHLRSAIILSAILDGTDYKKSKKNEFNGSTVRDRSLQQKTNHP